MKILRKRPDENIFVGFKEEAKVIFDLSCWEEYFERAGRVVLFHQWPVETIYRSVQIEREGSTAIWIITANDTAKAGAGRTEMRCYIGDTLVESFAGEIFVGASEEVAGETPDPPSQSWQEQVLGAAQITALDNMFKVCAFIKDDVSAQYNAFKIAFGITGSGDSGDDGGGEEELDTEKALISISAVYSGGSVPVGTALTDLTGVVVTAYYSDDSQQNVTGYNLSGTIAEGENTVTVTYEGVTTTFTVTGVVESGGEETGVSGETTWTSGVPYTFEPIDGSYPDKSSGEITAYSTWARSPYLYCAGASTLRAVVRYQTGMFNGTKDNAFYDVDKNYVAPVDTDGETGTNDFNFSALNNAEVGTYADVPIPENAAYFIVSGASSLFWGAGESNGEPYVEYVPYE